jgi:hypothetical protein
MRINTNGEKDYRTDLYEHTAGRFDVSPLHIQIASHRKLFANRYHT